MKQLKVMIVILIKIENFAIDKTYTQIFNMDFFYKMCIYL